MLPTEFYVGSALVDVDSGLGVRVTFEEGLAISVRYSKEALVLLTAVSPAFTSSGLTLCVKGAIQIIRDFFLALF